MATTDRYALKRLIAGQSLSDDGYQFTDADRVLIDRLLYLGAESHRHDGATATASTAPAAPSLLTVTTAGAIPAGTRVYYKVTLVDVNGLESTPSTEVFVDTPAPLIEPGPPTLLARSTGGTLAPGNYYYALSAYANGINTQETKALSPGFITVPVGSTTNSIEIVFPALPAGATGWNIYRKRPGGARYDYLLSVAANVATPPTRYIDTGAAVEDCNRTTPVRNSTNAQNSVQVTIGGATPAVPVGMTWKVYRTYIGGNYDNTLLHHVVEHTADFSGIITPRYTDMGLSPMVGKPPTVGIAIASPPRIRFGDSADVQGALPLARVSAFPEMVAFSFEGTLSPRQGTSVWVCEYPRATIMGVRASLGRGYSPVATDVVVDVICGTNTATPTFASIFAALADQPRILVGAQIGTRVVPTAKRELLEGEALSIDIETAGGGATPNDRDLTVMVYLLVHGYTSDLSHLPAAI